MILVTGGTGLLGAHLILKLLQNGQKVKAVKRTSSKTERTLHIFSFYTRDADLLFNQIEWADCDILDYNEVRKVLEGCSRVYHCAAMVSFNTSDREVMLETNIQGTANLVNAAMEKGIEQFCHVSSVATLGRPPKGEAADEETYWTPSLTKQAYSISKYYSEMEVWRGIQEGLKAVIVNPSIIIGPGNWNEGSPKLFQLISKGMKFYTTGGTGFVNVNDVADAMILLMKPENFKRLVAKRFVLAENSYTFQEIFNFIADALNVKRPSIKAGKWMLAFGWRLAAIMGFITGKKPSITRDSANGSIPRRFINGEKITKELNFQYTPLNVTIQNVAAFYKADASCRFIS